MTVPPEDAAVPDYLGLPLGRFLDLAASGESTPGGGSAAAVVVALAAGLSCMSARLSTDHLPEATALAKRADRLRNEVAPLAWADAEAYGRVLAARRTQGNSVQEALSEAADVPLAVAETGAEVSRIAARLVKEGNPNLVGDAITAVLLAEAGVHATTRLVRINLSDGAIEDRRRLSRADEAVRNASSARRVVEGKARARSIRQR